MSLIHLSLVSHTSLIPVSRHSLTQNPPWRNRSSKLSGVPLIERQCFYMPGEIEIQVEFKLKLFETIMYFPRSFRELNLENWESGEGEIKCDIISIDEMTINVPSLGGLPSVWYLSGFAIIAYQLERRVGWSLGGLLSWHKLTVDLKLVLEHRVGCGPDFFAASSRGSVDFSRRSTFAIGIL